jgi:hypothetical protein
MRNLLLTLIGAALVLSSAPAASAQTGSYDREKFQEIPLVALLANPAAYDGKAVTITGFLTLEFEDSTLLLDKASWEAGATTNGIWVDQPRWLDKAEKHRMTRRYGTVSGTFDASLTGHMGAYGGGLRDVQNVGSTYTRAELVKDRVRDSERALWQFKWVALFFVLVGSGVTFAFWQFGWHRPR